jgi:arginyl-tRNA synthetase
MNIIEHLHQEFFAFLNKKYPQAAELGSSITFALNTDEAKKAFGDISSNASLVIAKAAKQNPQAVAQDIIAHFQHPHVAKIEAAGPGFLNVFLTPETFIIIAQDLFTQKKNFFSSPEHKPTAYSLEFVSANPTGPLHLGHGRGGIIGDVLGNILNLLHNNVTKEFYINDAGSQIQKLGNSFKIRCLQQLGQDVTLPEEGYQGQYLVELAQQCIQEHPDVATKDDSFFDAYAQDHLLAAIKKTLETYGIVYDVWFSEKTLHDSGAVQEAVNVLTKNGYTYESEGALWFASQKFGDDKDRVLRKNDGSWTYVAADVAYLQNKLARGAQKLVMVLGQDHHSYVVRLKGIMAALGHNPDQLTVILYQLVTLKQSGELVRMSKRAGTMVTLDDIIEIVGTDVARFFYLNRKADAHLDFDLDLALKKTDENPVYYIQYAYVRTKSILAKADLQSPLTAEDALGLSAEEHLMLKKIIALKELLAGIAQNYQTHLLSYYTIELAKLFHSYYAHHKVIDPSNPATTRARLFLVKLLQETFETTFSLLGINTPEKM